MRRHVVHELRVGSFADGQAVEPPDTALVGRFSTGQDHQEPDARHIRRLLDAGHISVVTPRNDRRSRSA